MKKIFVFIIFMLFVSELYSLEGKFGINFGVLGFGSDTNNKIEFNAKTGITGGYFYARALNFIYKTYDGLRFSYSPFVFFYNYDVAEEDKYSITLVNASVEYNFFNETSDWFNLGPFVSMSTLKIKQTDFIDFRSGLRISFQLALDEEGLLNSALLFLELGYKYNKYEKHGFYVTFGIDLILGCVFLFSGSDADKALDE